MMPTRSLRGILVLGCFFAAASCSAQDWAAAMFETTSHNFGAVAYGGKVEYDFVLTNKYAADVHIADVRSQLRLHDATHREGNAETHGAGGHHRPP